MLIETLARFFHQRFSPLRFRDIRRLAPSPYANEKKPVANYIRSWQVWPISIRVVLPQLQASAATRTRKSRCIVPSSWNGKKKKKTNAFVHRVAESEPTGDHASLDSRQPTIKI
ncbi:hypothetical protein KM043_008233 [Ampulex compressa]|nr:hypothetical protein KM043_008233 [Ampulex compressa]